MTFRKKIVLNLESFEKKLESIAETEQKGEEMLFTVLWKSSFTFEP